MKAVAGASGVAGRDAAARPAPSADALMRAGPVIPVLVVEDADGAADLAGALVEGGLKVLEVTLRTAAALQVIEAMSRAAPQAVIGAGTVLYPEQLKRAEGAGARFIVSPGLTEGVARAAEAAGLPLLAGVASAGDIMRGLDLGLDRFKFFPAETSGGATAIAALAAPFGGVRFCPTGGVNPNNARTYLAQEAVLCVGGAWVAPQADVARRDWAKITALARAAAALAA